MGLSLSDYREISRIAATLFAEIAANLWKFMPTAADLAPFGLNRIKLMPINQPYDKRLSCEDWVRTLPTRFSHGNALEQTPWIYGAFSRLFCDNPNQNLSNKSGRC